MKSLILPVSSVSAPLQSYSSWRLFSPIEPIVYTQSSLPFLLWLYFLSHFNRARAAKVVDTSIRTLRNKIRAYKACGFIGPEASTPSREVLT